jgi:hypothetical protein
MSIYPWHLLATQDLPDNAAVGHQIQAPLAAKMPPKVLFSSIYSACCANSLTRVYATVLVVDFPQQGRLTVQQ